MKNVFKKMILTAALVVTTLVVLPTTAEAKTKTLTYNINNVTADEFCKDIDNKGADAVFLERDKNIYRIKLTVKASSKKDGRAKVKKFAKKVMNAKDNQFGLSYGIKYDDYNSEKYDAKKKVYTTRLYQSANDIYYLNAITKSALHKNTMETNKGTVYLKEVFPDYETFKQSSESVKVQTILYYMGQNCLVASQEKKGMTFSWKKAFQGKMGGMCSDFANMYGYALRLIAYDYDLQYEINWKANHEVVIVKVINSMDTYDYFLGDGGGFYPYITFGVPKTAKISSSEFDVWQVKASKEYKVSKLEKAAFKYATKKTVSELERIAKN